MVISANVSGTMMSRSRRSMWLAIAHRPSRDAVRNRLTPKGRHAKRQLAQRLDAPRRGVEYGQRVTIGANPARSRLLHALDRDRLHDDRPGVRHRHRHDARLVEFVGAVNFIREAIVGTEATFVWQTWDDWGNHSLAKIYLPMVQSYWNVIKWGPRNYPQ